MIDCNGNKITLGVTVKPLVGFWKGIEGEVVKIEDGEDNSYCPEQLIVVT